MSNFIIEYSKDVKQDLIHIKTYIKYNLQEPKIANDLIFRIRNEINKLINNPEIYRILNEDIISKLNIRKINIDNYIVFYRIEHTSIQIIRIMHKRRNWTNLL